MTLQQQCCTLEQGKHLVELGIKSESTFWHMPAKDGPHGESIRYGWHGDAIAPAFNVAELGVLLPLECESGKDEGPGGLFQDSQEWCKGYSARYNPLKGRQSTESAITEAQARASLLIHLLENNIITLKKQ